MARPKAKTKKANEASDGKNVVKGKLVPTVYDMVKMEHKVLFHMEYPLLTNKLVMK